MDSKKLTHKQFVKNVIRLMDHYVGQEKKIVKHMQNLVHLYDDANYRSKYMMAKWNIDGPPSRHLVFNENDNSGLQPDYESGDKIKEDIEKLKPEQEIKLFEGLPLSVWQDVLNIITKFSDTDSSNLAKFINLLEKHQPKLLNDKKVPEGKINQRQFVFNAVKLMNRHIDGEEKLTVNILKVLLNLYDDENYRSNYVLAKWDDESEQRHLLYDENEYVDIDDEKWKDKILKEITRFKPKREIKKLEGLPVYVWQSVFDGVFKILNGAADGDTINRDGHIPENFPKIVDFLELIVKNCPSPIHGWLEEKKWQAHYLWRSTNGEGADPEPFVPQLEEKVTKLLWDLKYRGTNYE